MIKGIHLEHAFQDSARLLAHQGYLSLTRALLEYLYGYDGVESASVYEVFDQQPDDVAKLGYQYDPVVRRVLSRGQMRDDGLGKVAQVLAAHDAGRHFLIEKAGPWLALDVSRSVVPRRIVLIHGHIDEIQTCQVLSLLGIYAARTSEFDESERDSLTGLLNREAFEMQTGRLIQEMKQSDDGSAAQTWLALVSVDPARIRGPLNARKRATLWLFSHLLRKCFRHLDGLYHLGRGEFAVLLHGSEYEGARDSLRRFVRRVEAYQFPLPNLTCAVGFTGFGHHSVPGLMLEDASKALLLAQSRPEQNLRFRHAQSAVLAEG